jgi:hypothetical protein
MHAVDARVVEPFPVVRAGDLDAEAPATRWLVRDVWLSMAVGWVAGAPKLGKTHLSLDLAVSVASATPCLGHFPVEQPGPVVIYLAEDTLPCVRERLAAICAHRRLDLASLDIYVITAPRLRLDDPTDRERLDATVARLGARLLILDPLVRMHACDESSAPEMAELLGFLRELSRRHQMAITICHHLTKRHHHRPGQALRGSGDLHAWSDSSAYLIKHNEQLVMTLEHRAAASPDPIPIQLVCGPNVPAHLEIVRADGTLAAPSLDEQVRRHLLELGAPVTRDTLRRTLRVNNARLGEALSLLQRQGLIVRTDAGWVAQASARPSTRIADSGHEPVSQPQGGEPEHVDSP